ncbi:MAG TPA: type I methionyl aminopeptidase [Candidatus Acidoferrales bacterium]|nr:type I methionyl aminopeptidase [Candidatus Acidoferrales bacterium]
MSIDDDRDLQGLRAAGRVVRETLDAMRAAVAPGVSTAELDAIAAGVFREHGARSAPRLVYDFPGETCISLNDEVVHGIPSAARRLAEGDLVKLDVTVEKDGYMADAAVTCAVGRVSERARRLIACAETAFRRALREVRAGRRVCDVGGAVEGEVVRRGFSVVRSLTGHGIGRTIHEDPMVPNWFDPTARAWLTEGLVITVEPIIAMGSGDAHEADDGWTIRTNDGSLAAHFEHTLVVTRGQPLLLTAA